MATRKSSTSTQASSYTPLSIIAVFIALSETVAGLAAVHTIGIVQIIFAIFSATFPVLVAGSFFMVLWARAYVFYPPRDFGGGVDVQHYVQAMRHQAFDSQGLQVLVQKSITEAFSSQEAKVAISRISNDSCGQSEDALQVASTTLIEQAVNRLKDSVLSIDISAFTGASAPLLIFPYDANEEAFALLSSIYFQISDHVPPFTYGQKWVLQDLDSGKLVLPTTINWDNGRALEKSDLSVQGFGLTSGMRLRALLP